MMTSGYVEFDLPSMIDPQGDLVELPRRGTFLEQLFRLTSDVIRQHSWADTRRVHLDLVLGIDMHVVLSGAILAALAVGGLWLLRRTRKPK
ncbi:MAG: hypothetical protein DMD96_06125 [Candidatus Rokuibacteriota bacterium]|nr:MAG: hypothetical protein DMD96_06125 [Candidatus Rokubacteria bacterium]